MTREREMDDSLDGKSTGKLRSYIRDRERERERYNKTRGGEGIPRLTLRLSLSLSLSLSVGVKTRLIRRRGPLMRYLSKEATAWSRVIGETFKLKPTAAAVIARRNPGLRELWEKCLAAGPRESERLPLRAE